MIDTNICRDCDEPALNGLETCERHTATRHRPAEQRLDQVRVLVERTGHLLHDLDQLALNGLETCDRHTAPRHRPAEQEFVQYWVRVLVERTGHLLHDLDQLARADGVVRYGTQESGFLAAARYLTSSVRQPVEELGLTDLLNGARSGLRQAELDAIPRRDAAGAAIANVTDLSPRMRGALLGAVEGPDGMWWLPASAVSTNTRVALIDRGLVTAGSQHYLTPRGQSAREVLIGQASDTDPTH